MPLSDEEQRILSEIEQQLYQSDPALARDIADTTVYTAAYRNLKWAMLGFVVGLAVLILAFGTYVPDLLRRLPDHAGVRAGGRAQRAPARRGGMQQMTQSMKTAGLRDALGNTSTRLKDRMKRDESE